MLQGRVWVLCLFFTFICPNPIWANDEKAENPFEKYGETHVGEDTNKPHAHMAPRYRPATFYVFVDPSRFDKLEMIVSGFYGPGVGFSKHVSLDTPQAEQLRHQCHDWLYLTEDAAVEGNVSEAIGLRPSEGVQLATKFKTGSRVIVRGIFHKNIDFPHASVGELEVGNIDVTHTFTVKKSSSADNGAESERPSADELIKARQIVLENLDNQGLANLKELQGVKRLVVGVNIFRDGKAEATDPMAAEAVKAAMIKLGAAGIWVLDVNDWLSRKLVNLKAMRSGQPHTSDGFVEQPVLIQTITVSSQRHKTVAVSVETGVDENVILRRDMLTSRQVNSWKKEEPHPEVVKLADLQDHILKVTMKQIDEFLSDWKKQNPAK